MFYKETFFFWRTRPKHASSTNYNVKTTLAAKTALIFPRKECIDFSPKKVDRKKSKMAVQHIYILACSGKKKR